MISVMLRPRTQISTVFGAKIADHLAKAIDREMVELLLVFVPSAWDLRYDFPHQIEFVHRRFQVAKSFCVTQIALLLAFCRFRLFLVLDFGRSFAWRAMHAGIRI
jgi:hypothetical protein